MQNVIENTHAKPWYLASRQNPLPPSELALQLDKHLNPKPSSVQCYYHTADQRDVTRSELSDYDLDIVIASASASDFDILKSHMEKSVIAAHCIFYDDDRAIVLQGTNISEHLEELRTFILSLNDSILPTTQHHPFDIRDYLDPRNAQNCYLWVPVWVAHYLSGKTAEAFIKGHERHGIASQVSDFLSIDNPRDLQHTQDDLRNIEKLIQVSRGQRRAQFQYQDTKYRLWDLLFSRKLRVYTDSFEYHYCTHQNLLTLPEITHLSFNSARKNKAVELNRIIRQTIKEGMSDVAFNRNIVKANIKTFDHARDLQYNKDCFKKIIAQQGIYFITCYMVEMKEVDYHTIAVINTPKEIAFFCPWTGFATFRGENFRNDFYDWIIDEIKQGKKPFLGCSQQHDQFYIEVARAPLPQTFVEKQPQRGISDTLTCSNLPCANAANQQITDPLNNSSFCSTKCAKDNQPFRKLGYAKRNRPTPKSFAPSKIPTNNTQSSTRPSDAGVFSKTTSTNLKLTIEPPVAYLYAKQYEVARLDRSYMNNIVALCTAGINTCFAVICVGKSKISLAHTHLEQNSENPIKQIVHEADWSHAQQIKVVRHKPQWEDSTRAKQFNNHLDKIRDSIKQTKLRPNIEVIDANTMGLATSVTVFRDGTIDTECSIKPKTLPCGPILTPDYYQKHFLNRSALATANLPKALTSLTYQKIYANGVQLLKKGDTLHALQHVMHAIQLHPQNTSNSEKLNLARMYYTQGICFKKSDDYSSAIDTMENAHKIAQQLGEEGDQLKQDASGKIAKFKKHIETLKSALVK